MKKMAKILQGAPDSPEASLESHTAAELDASGQTEEVNLDESMRRSTGSSSATKDMPEVVDLDAEVDAELAQSSSQTSATQERDMTETYFEGRESLGEPVTSASRGQSTSSSG